MPKSELPAQGTTLPAAIPLGQFTHQVLPTAALLAATRHFLTQKLANLNTRDNYGRTVVDFLRWCYDHGVRADQVTAEIMGHYRDDLSSLHDVPTVHNKLSGLTRYYKLLMEEGAATDNPARKVERPKLERDEGQTPMIPIKEASALLAVIDTTTVVGLRDRAIIGCPRRPVSNDGTRIR